MNTKAKHVVTTTFGSLIAIALLVPQTAVAEDAKIYHGAMCQAGAGDAIQFFVNGSLNIDPNSGHSVTCPVVRDSVNKGINSASITAVDNSPVEDVECVLSSARADGNAVSSSRRTTSGINTAPQTLQFGTLSAVSGGFYLITCRIPKAQPAGAGGFNYSRILSYRVNEND
ncbi:hypothetical protein [Methylococcus mesophilus]|uniref:hypothetical protein n=1 Tax=Methylococcus mesophilus TaxID=2993564 RepID=UPI00224A8BB2|nr:hypothetical protein [Methylococcus mesophilus]UZR27234.1 hypothetical protein OOT43_10850 [Methylococcus mesophilus]